MIELIMNPWPWYVAGPLIFITMALLLYSGRRFGVSSNLQTLCTIGGAGKFSDYFRFDWRINKWNLVFVLGTIIGGFLSGQFLMADQNILLAESTVTALSDMGFDDPGSTFLPDELFSTDALYSWKGLLILILGGFFVGFGARYADGCTSGHAISGLSNLQIPSLIAVIGFFVGGLTMVWLIFPIFFS